MLQVLEKISIIEPVNRSREETAFSTIPGKMSSFRSTDPSTYTPTSNVDCIFNDSPMEIVQPIDIYGNRENFNNFSCPLFNRSLFFDTSVHPFPNGYNIFGTYIGIKKTSAQESVKVSFTSPTMFNGYVKDYSAGKITFSYTSLPYIYTELDRSSLPRFSISDNSEFALSILDISATQNTFYHFYTGSIQAEEKYKEIYGTLESIDYTEKELVIDISSNGTLSQTEIDSIQNISQKSNLISFASLGSYTINEASKKLVSVDSFPVEDSFGVSNYIYGPQSIFSNSYYCRTPVLKIALNEKYTMFAVKIVRTTSSIIPVTGFNMRASL